MTWFTKPVTWFKGLGDRPGTFVVTNFLWVAALLVLVFGMATRWKWLHSIHDPFGGVVPFMVPWAGTLGGVSISLVSVAYHANNWNGKGFGFWHLMRPVLGLIFGTVAVLMVILILNSVKVTQTSTGHYPPAGVAVLAVISFVVGYREATFRALVMRVVDVILGPGGSPGTASLALVPSVVTFAKPAAGQSSSESTTHLYNASSDTIRVTTASIAISDQTVTVATFAPTDLQPNNAIALTLTWTPAVPPKPLDTTMHVTAANLTVSALLQGEA